MGPQKTFYFNSLSQQIAVDKNLGKPLNRRPIFTPPLRAGSKNLFTFNGDGYELPFLSLGQGPLPDPFSLKTPDMYHHSALKRIRKGNLLSGNKKISKNNDLSKLKMITGV
jgi:hypothetical protein